MRTARMIACLAVAAGCVTQALPVPAAAAAAPPATTSRYMKTTDKSVAYNEGCAAGKASQQGIIVLDFGSPSISGVTYGTLLLGANSFRSLNQIEEAAKNFLWGYWSCSPWGPTITLAVGTSNYHGQTNYNHGRAFAQIVNNIAVWLSQKGFAGQEDAAGASDLELDWNTASASRAWVTGYDSNDMRPYYDYGDAAGCPPYGSCDNGWTQEDVWYVSWGSPPALPLPEIYTTNGSMAAEWYRLSLYGYTNHARAISIAGSLTQYQACIDAGSTCSGTNNRPAAGWGQLYAALNNDGRTAQTLPDSSDITCRRNA